MTYKSLLLDNIGINPTKDNPMESRVTESRETVRHVKLGTRNVQFPSPELQPLEDSNHLLGDRDALWKELDDKGYLYIRGLHNREEVLQGRLAVLEFIMSEGEGKIDLKEQWEKGVLDLRCGGGCLPYMEGKNNITHSPEIIKVLEGPRPYEFFKTLFGEEARTFDYKWLRAVHRQVYTGAHVDNVYMSRGTSRLLTMWTPFGDVDMGLGCLAVCEGSSKLPGFQKLHDTYSSTDIEAINLNGTGWFTEDPFEITQKFGGQWKTTNYRAGDVLIFGMRTVHMSTANLTDLVRISCDTRWQPASEPADHRYVGEMKPIAKFGHYGKDNIESESVTMNQLKEKWGLQ